MSGQLRRRIGFISSEPAGLAALLLVAALAYCPAAYAEPIPAEENMTAPADPAPIPAEGPTSSASAAPATEEQPAEDPLAPSLRVTGSVWRSNPGIVFLQTPIGVLSLSSKTALRDVKTSHKITLSVNGSNTAVDVRDRRTGSLVHRYLSGIPRYTSGEKQDLLLWTPEGDQTFAPGAYAAKIPDDAESPIALEVSETGTVKGVHDLQFDLQISQAPKADSQTRMRLHGTISKLKSSFVFLDTPLGVVTVSAKTGVRNAKVGQDMTVWIHGDHVAIDLYQGDSAAPVRRFLSGRLVYAASDKNSVMLWTPEGDKTFQADHRGKSSLASVKEGTPITVELDQQGEIVEIRRLN
ncbi:MAG: hypothetical protein AB7G68_09050 [Nitrospiraceae bacterium]